MVGSGADGFANRLNNKGGNAAKNKVQTRGQHIMEVAEMLRPYLLKKLEGCRDENGMPVQNARVRGISLILAQELVKLEEAHAA